MNNEQDSILLRKQLYNEIWEISVAGVAKKYNVHYAKMIYAMSPIFQSPHQDTGQN